MSSLQENLFSSLHAATPAFDVGAVAPAMASAEKPHAGLSVCVLGSGSGGNATAVRLDGRLVMIDLGFGPVTITRRLQQARVSPSDIRAVCLTHLDQDHFRPHWLATLIGWRIPVYIHHWHLKAFEAIPRATDMIAQRLVHCFDGQSFEPIAGLRISPLHLAHDAKGTSGFHLATRHGSVGYATDLGHVPEELVHRFSGVDLLAIECNYDPPMQLRSTRPLFLKRRIMGHAGHLSNQQAFDAVCRIVDRSPPGTPRHVVLLHRSRQCNDPQIVRSLFEAEPRLVKRVTLTEQRRRSRWFHVTPGNVAPQQLQFAF